ncbi:hypothetical protein ACWTU6_15825 [Mesorhizobium sp. BHbsci]
MHVFDLVRGPKLRVCYQVVAEGIAAMIAANPEAVGNFMVSDATHGIVDVVRINAGQAEAPRGCGFSMWIAFPRNILGKRNKTTLI